MGGGPLSSTTSGLERPIFLNQSSGTLGLRTYRIHTVADRLKAASLAYDLQQANRHQPEFISTLMTHKGMPPDVRHKQGTIYDNLIGLSRGIEDANDLKRDLLQTFGKAVSESCSKYIISRLITAYLTI